MTTPKPPVKRASGRSRTAAKKASEAQPESPEAPVAGAVGAALAKFVAELDLADDPRRQVLAEQAKALAAELDGGAGMATAAVNKELRATLAELEGDDAGDDDAFAEWEKQLGSAT